MAKPHLIFAFSLGLAGLMFASGCAATQTPAPLPPTTSLTQAYQTVAARLSQTGAALSLTLPATSPALSETPAVSPGPPDQATASPQDTASGAPTCDQAAPGIPIDITIPDDTQIIAGQPFTKVWRLQNIGSCTWTAAEYGVTWFSGEQLGAPLRVALTTNVPPQRTVDIAVDMVAPNQPGTYQSNWKLYNAADVLFGIGPAGGSPIWVRIVVVPQPTGSGVAPSPSPTATHTPTPPPITSGAVVLQPGDHVDLDNKQVNPSTGVDLSFETNQKGSLILMPASGARLGYYGAETPGMGECQAGGFPDEAIALVDLAVGDYFCYQTNQGFPGRAQLTNYNPDAPAIVLDILTWYLP